MKHGTVTIGHDQFDPALDHVQRPGGKIVAGLVVGEHHLQGDFLAGFDLLRRCNVHAHDRTARPLVRDFGNLDFPAQPLLGHRGMNFSSFELMKQRDVLIGSQMTVASMFSVVGRPVVIGDVAAGRIIAGHQRHMTFSATDGLRRVTRAMPTAVLPTVVLILPLHLPDVGVHALVDVLLVASCAELRRLIKRS